MAQRPWILLAIWCGLFLMVLVGSLTGGDHAVLGMPFLISPIVALVTVVRLASRKEREEVTRGWAIAQRVVTGACVVLAICGLVGSASEMAVVGGAMSVKNWPLALLFFLALIASYRGLVRPTPRGTAIPAMVVHLAWLPLFLGNMRDYVALDQWQRALMGIGLLGLLAFTGFAAIIALVGFTGMRPRVPEARQL